MTLPNIAFQHVTKCGDSDGATPAFSFIKHASGTYGWNDQSIYLTYGGGYYSDNVVIFSPGLYTSGVPNGTSNAVMTARIARGPQDSSSTETDGFIGAGNALAFDTNAIFRDNQDSLGFHIVKTTGNVFDLYAFSSDGTAEETDTGINMAEDQEYVLTAVNNGTSILFYVDGVLKATHSTHIPSDPIIIPFQFGITSQTFFDNGISYLHCIDYSFTTYHS